MKKLILLALMTIMIIGCVERNPDGSISSEKSISMITNTIDSCEYITWGYGMSHKGNCKYCAERRKKELEELIIKLKEE